MPKKTARVTVEVFWSRVDKMPSGCWEYTQFRNPKGYGSISFEGRSIATHRLAWKLVNGPIPPGMFVCHRCDNPPCCNPDHLFLGTHQDNTDDMVAKRRQATGLRNGRHTHPERTSRGEHRPTAKLTWDAVRKIRDMRGQCSYRALGALFGVSGGRISRIMNNQDWREPDAANV